MIPGPGQRVRLTLTLEPTAMLPPNFHFGTLAQHLCRGIPFKLHAADVEIPGSSTAKPKAKPATKAPDVGGSK